MNSPVTPLNLTTVIYESEKNYILIKDVTNGAVLMAVTKNKSIEAFTTLIAALNNDDFSHLKEILGDSDL
jgi:hypothetical protein